MADGTSPASTAATTTTPPLGSLSLDSPSTSSSATFTPTTDEASRPSDGPDGRDHTTIQAAEEALKARLSVLEDRAEAGVVEESLQAAVEGSTTNDAGDQPKEKSPRKRVSYRRYAGEQDIPDIMELVDTELSEPYNFYTYRYFLSDWPNLCFMAYDGKTPVGTIVCKQDVHRDKLNRGYLAMLSTRPSHRGLGIGTHLARLAIQEMTHDGCQEVVLETEVDNLAALRFYTKLGFVREKRLFRFYMNAKDAFRLFLPLSEEVRRSVPRVEMEEYLGEVGV